MRHVAKRRSNRPGRCGRSLYLNGGSSKKTQSPGDDVMAGFCQAPEVAVSHDGMGAVAVSAAGRADSNAEIEQLQ